MWLLVIWRDWPNVKNNLKAAPEHARAEPEHSWLNSVSMSFVILATYPEARLDVSTEEQNQD